jgi:hypothetical protein
MFRQLAGYAPPCLLLILAPQILQASPANKLDTAHIHRTYLEGDFDLAIELIEDARKYGGPFSHADSVFLFKHLGVMHAAKYETREQGKRYMVKLLEVEPTAKILDMYASDMIYMIFKNIKDEFDATRPQFAEPTRKHRPKTVQEGKPRGYAWVGWTAGMAAAAGGIALAVHLLSEESKQKENFVGAPE